MERSKNRNRSSNGRRAGSKDPEKRLKQVLRSSLRQIWLRYSTERQKVLKDSRINSPERKKDGSWSKKPNYYYQCKTCQCFYPLSGVQVDHVVPIGPTPESIDKWGDWIKALFCSADNLSILCSLCHHEKTRKDRESMRSAENVRRNETAA